MKDLSRGNTELYSLLVDFTFEVEKCTICVPVWSTDFCRNVNFLGDTRNYMETYREKKERNNN